MGDTDFIRNEDNKMKEFRYRFTHWWGFLLKLVISSIVIICMAISGSLSGVNDWNALSTTQKIIIVCSTIALAGTNLNSLLDKTFAEKSNGHDKPAEAPATPKP